MKKKHFKIGFDCYINHFNFRLARQQEVGFNASLCDCPLKLHVSNKENSLQNPMEKQIVIVFKEI